MLKGFGRRSRLRRCDSLVRARTPVTVAILLLALVIVVAPRAGETQRPTKIPRVGFLSPRSPSDTETARRLEAFRQGLRDLGYVEGRNIVIESRSAEAQYERLTGLAVEMVGLQVDVIVTYGLPATEAAKRATGTIPIVMASALDAVAHGVVASLARPGGNVTGVSFMSPELAGKQLEILKEVVPKISLVALLGNPANPGNAAQVQYVQDSARRLGVQVRSLEARGPGEIDGAFAAMTSAKADGVIVLVDAVLLEHRTQIANVAARRRLPTVSGMIENVEAGGLMSYGPSVPDMFRHMATFVDKVLKGAKPADLPVEQPTKFDLVISVKTAKALGLRIPRHVLLRADRIIE